MFRTKKQYVVECKKVWQWLAKDGTRWKSDYFKAFPQKPYPENGCYFCQYDTDHLGEDGCDNCPALNMWNRAKYCGCELSPYEKWDSSKTTKARKKYAKQIVEICNKILKKMN